MKLTDAQHYMYVCKHHASPDVYQSDPAWAQRFLDTGERDELITPDEAAEIREACGWLVQGTLI